jgi:uncharacterized protein YecE (DUF72 family)
MDVRVGLCGWRVSQSSYVRHFPVVEVQHRFDQPPADAVLRRWRAQVPDPFEFTIKAWCTSSTRCRARPRRPSRRPTGGMAPRVHARHTSSVNTLPRAGDAERFLALLSR